MEESVETVLLELAEWAGPAPPGTAGYSPDCAGERLDYRATASALPEAER